MPGQPNDEPLSCYSPGLDVLKQANISRIPSDFDGHALMAELKRLSIRHTVAASGEKPLVRVADLDGVIEVGILAKRLSTALGALVDDEKREAGLRALLREMPTAASQVSVITGREPAATRLLVLRQELQAVFSACGPAAKDLENRKADGAPFPADGQTAFGSLVAVDLPALFEKHLRRKCGLSAGRDARGPTDGLRFIIAALQAMGLGTHAPATIVKTVSRFKEAARRDNAP